LRRPKAALVPLKCSRSCGNASELKSLRSSTENAVSSTGWWNVGCTVFEVDHLVVEHHSAVWLWDGRITWHPIVSQSLGRGFYELELEHPKWFCLADGWRVWEPPATTMVADTHRQLACSAYASPSTTRWVRNCNGGWAPVRSWPVRNLDSEFAEVDLATGAMEANVVLKVEQYRNNIVGDVENISPSPCRIKKATEGGPLATDAHGAKCSLNNCLHQPHYTSPDSPPVMHSY
jgi:hypothetical protein